MEQPAVTLAERRKSSNNTADEHLHVSLSLCTVTNSAHHSSTALLVDQNFADKCTVFSNTFGGEFEDLSCSVMRDEQMSATSATSATCERLSDWSSKRGEEG